VNLNQLYFDHQVALMRASATSDRRDSTRHRHDATSIARTIACWQGRAGAPAARQWQAHAGIPAGENACAGTAL
jgi:hypothetical protein